MTFLNPLGLLGLLTLPVIVFLHLRRERARQMLVSSLDLWSFLDTKHTGTRARYLPLTWLLLVHLIIAALLSLAFSQPHLDLPFFPSDERHLIVLLDTSSSMLATDTRPTRFDAARDDVRALLSGSGAADLITIVTFGARVEVLGDSRQNDISTILSDLDKLQAGAVGERLSEGLALAASHASTELPIDLRIFTDGAFPAPQIEDYPYVLRWERYGNSASNQAVMDIAVEVIGENRVQVFTKLANFGGQPVQGEMTLLADGEAVDSTSIQLPPDSTLGHVWDLTGQPSYLEVQLSGSDTLPADDRAYYSVPRSNAVNVALVSDTAEPLLRALQAAGDVNVLRFTPANYAPSQDIDLYVFSDWLPETLPNGDVLVLNPPLDNLILPVAGQQDITALPLVETHALLEGIDFAGVRWGQAAVLQNQSSLLDTLVSAGDLPLLLRGQMGETQVTIFAPVLEDGNFTRHPAFPVLISNAVQQVRGESFPASLQTGQVFGLPSDEATPLVRVETPDGESQQLFSPRVSTEYSSTQQFGFYRIESVAQTGEITVDRVGVNAGEVLESDLTQGDWLADFETTSVSSAPTAPGLDLTPWLLLFVFALLALEGWLAWR